MIITVSGKKGVGKDTVGNIINYLIVKKYWKAVDWNFYCFQGDSEKVEKSLLLGHSVKLTQDVGLFEIKKFADKLKDMTCMIIGCTREQLEDQKFKETELGEEWNLYNIRASNGEYFAINYTLREAQQYIDYPYEYDIVKMTPRKVLQLLGTECGRNIIHSNVWVNSLMADYKFTYETEDIYPNWIITDCRFPNEAQAVKDKEGLIIRVNRDTDGEIDNHPSETSLDDYRDFDYIIDNNSTIETLIEEVRAILTKEKLL